MNPILGSSGQIPLLLKLQIVECYNVFSSTVFSFEQILKTFSTVERMGTYSGKLQGHVA